MPDKKLVFAADLGGLSYSEIFQLENPHLVALIF